MKLVKTSAVACVLSALLAGPVLAQDLSTDAKPAAACKARAYRGA